MGQELLNRGVVPSGSIWGASALFHKKYHKLLVKTHLDFIKAGAEIIVTNTFGSRMRKFGPNSLRLLKRFVFSHDKPLGSGQKS